VPESPREETPSEEAPAEYGVDPARPGSPAAPTTETTTADGDPSDRSLKPATQHADESIVGPIEEPVSAGDTGAPVAADESVEPHAVTATDLSPPLPPVQPGSPEEAGTSDEIPEPEDQA